jgi:hypothetical protein
MFYIYYNDETYKKSLIKYKIHELRENLKKEDIPPNMCNDTKTSKKIFDNFQIYDAMTSSTFSLYYIENQILLGIACVTIYGDMWEVSYICTAKKGVGTLLIKKIKDIAVEYELPITIYGLGVYLGSQFLYKKNKFIEVNGSHQYRVHGRRTSKTQSSPRVSPRASSRRLKKTFKRVRNNTKSLNTIYKNKSKHNRNTY